MSDPSFDLRERLQAALGSVYQIERELGGGGMSRVFVAEETSLGRKVVVKVLSSELAAELSAERFEREVRLAAQLQHPQIVPVLTAGSAGGVPYYTMPLVDGESLRAHLARDGAQPIPKVVSVLRDVAKALEFAHARGVVHRDIKPDNVLLSGSSAAVTDFGIAKALWTRRPRHTRRPRSRRWGRASERRRTWRRSRRPAIRARIIARTSMRSGAWRTSCCRDRRRSATGRCIS